LTESAARESSRGRDHGNRRARNAAASALHQRGIDTTTPAGKALFQMLGVFAKFERAMIRERVMAGLGRARAQGRTLGRPKVAAEVEASILTMLATGKGIGSTARALGVGTGTVQRVQKETVKALRQEQARELAGV
jgi:DNA invertase Pin-like site-specific DNA recombinase